MQAGGRPHQGAQDRPAQQPGQGRAHRPGVEQRPVPHHRGAQVVAQDGDAGEHQEQPDLAPGVGPVGGQRAGRRGTRSTGRTGPGRPTGSGRAGPGIPSGPFRHGEADPGRSLQPVRQQPRRVLHLDGGAVLVEAAADLHDAARAVHGRQRGARRP